jgi:phage tail sheath gpL-like
MPRTAALTIAGTLKLLIEEQPETNVTITLFFDHYTVTAKGTSMAYTLPTDKDARVKVSYFDNHGNPATIDGDVNWDSSDDEMIRVTVDLDDTTNAVISAIGPAGNAQVSASADADLGQGTREVICTLDVTVVAGEAVIGRIEPVGEPGEIPHAAPR